MARKRAAGNFRTSGGGGVRDNGFSDCLEVQCYYLRKMPMDPTKIVTASASLIGSSPVAESLSEAWAALVGDRIANWRLLNIAKQQLKVNEEFKKLGLKPNIDKIPERFAITWFEEASKQDEDDIQALFARLLARAAAGENDALDRRNIEIVSKLTPNDAALFLEMAAGGWGAKRRGRLHWEETGKLFSYGPTKVDVNKLGRSYEHLITLGLLSRQTMAEEKLNDRSFRQGPRVQTKVSNVVLLTVTGESVYKAVKVIEQTTAPQER